LYEQARQDAETKSMLLREVNHRVKNNLSAILGLLSIERRHAAKEQSLAYQALVNDLTNRIKGLDQVHSLLSAARWQPLLLSDLAQQIIRTALPSLSSGKSVAVTVTPSPVRVAPDQAHNLALIINELATNTVKHALQGQDTVQITVSITLDGDTVQCEFRDDGPGYAPDVLRGERQNVGMYLVRTLVRKGLRGELDLGNDRGAVTTIRFKVMG
jgi:two-component sensor histidine kinase